LVARLPVTATIWVPIQTTVKNTIWATKAKEWPTYSSQQKELSIKYVPIVVLNEDYEFCFLLDAVLRGLNRFYKMRVDQLIDFLNFSKLF
jgi:hypothetical protein